MYSSSALCKKLSLCHFNLSEAFATFCITAGLHTLVSGATMLLQPEQWVPDTLLLLYQEECIQILLLNQEERYQICPSVVSGRVVSNTTAVSGRN